MIKLTSLDPNIKATPDLWEANGPFVIGRSEDADICVPDDTVSRRHVRLTPLANGLWSVVDLNSHNGTFLKGERIRDSVLRPGQVLGLGDVLLHIEDGSPQIDSNTPRRPAKDVIVMTTISEAADVKSLAEMPPARLDNEHLEALLQAWSALASFDTDHDRLVALVHMMTAPPFSTWHACVLRLVDDLDIEDVPVVASHLAHNHYIPRGFEPYLSRRAIIKAHQTGDAVYASSGFGGGQAGTSTSPITITEAARVPRDIVCVPWIDPGEGPLALYLTMPPGQVSSEWVTFYRLAVRQLQEASHVRELSARASQLQQVEEELRKAASIQRAIQASDFTHRGVQIAVSFSPCYHVGGDLTIAEVLPNGRIAIVLGDITGHGLGAALIGSSVHAIIKSLLRTGASITQAVEAVNQMLLGGEYEGRFVTLFIATIDPQTFEIDYVNAGHPPILAISPTGLDIWPAGEHFPLGVTEQPVEISKGRLDPGSTLFVYSDGFIELQHTDQTLLGSDRLGVLFSEVVSRFAGDPFAIGQAIEEQLAGLRASPVQADDETLMIIGRGP